jgi:tellurite resistance protein
MFQRKAVLAGAIAGAVGAGAWALIGYSVGYEVGYLAWGIGGLVGFAVAWGNAGVKTSPMAAGLLAVGISVLSIVGGKYLTVVVTLSDPTEVVQELMENDEYVMSYAADVVVEELENSGQAVQWPLGVDPDFADSSEDYPPAIWAEAEVRWNELSEEERSEFRNLLAEDLTVWVSSNNQATQEEVFLETFGPLDILFFGLAIVTAFGAAGGTRKTQAEVAEEYLSAMKLAMLKVLLADGVVRDEELSVVRDVYRRMSGLEITEEEIRGEALEAQSDNQDLYVALTELTPYLNDENKEMIIRAAFFVAAADGDFQEEEQALISEIARSIDMSESHLRGVLEGVTSPR